MLFTQFSAFWGSKNTVNTDAFELKSAKQMRYVRGFLRVAPKTTVFFWNVFCTWPFKNIGIYGVFATCHVVVFQHKNCTHCILITVFCALKFANNASKMVPKPSPKTAFSDPWFFDEFHWFFDDFLTPPRSPNNAITPAVWRILVKNHFSPNWKSSKCSSDMQAGASFFRAIFKKHRDGGGPAAPPAPWPGVAG